MVEIPVFDRAAVDRCAVCDQPEPFVMTGYYIGECAAVRYRTCLGCCAALMTSEGSRLREALIKQHRERASQCIADGVEPIARSLGELLT